MREGGGIGRVTVASFLVVVAKDHLCAGEALLVGILEDFLQGADEARVVGRAEEDERGDHDGGVEDVAALVALGEVAAVKVVAALHDLVVELVADVDPSEAVRAGEAGALLAEAHAAVQRHPEHDLGVEEVLDLAAGLPDRHVLFVAHLGHVVHHAPDREPLVVGDWVAVLVVQVDAVQQFAVDVQLCVEDGRVADAHGLAALVPFQMAQLHLGDLVLAADGEHERQEGTFRARPGLLLRVREDPVEDEVHVRLRLLAVAHLEEDVEGERRVPDPGVPVVPVAAAAHVLRQGKCGRRHDGARRLVRQ